MRITIIGASGHGRVVSDIARLSGYDDIIFLDDDPSIAACGSFPVVGTTDEIQFTDGDLFVAIGNAVVRKRVMEQFPNRHFPVLIHPDSVIADSACIGQGSVVMAGAVVNPYATLGCGCIVNTCSSVDHDCVIADYVHVSVGAHVCGSVVIGETSWIGAGATVSNNVVVSHNTVIGAGAVVVKDITAPGTYVGVPAVRLLA